MSFLPYKQSNLLIDISAAFLIIVTVFMLTKLFGGWATLPYWDHWGIINSHYKNDVFDWQSFLSQHNDHRILPSKILFLIDFKLFKGTNAFLYFCNYLLSCLIFVVILFPFTRGLNDKDGGLKVWHILSLAIFLGLHLVTAKNLNWAFQSHFYFAPLFLLLSLRMLWSQRLDEPINRSFIIAVGLTGLSLFSLASGIVSPIIFVFGLLVLRQNLRKTLVAIIIFAVFYSMFFYKYGYIGANSTVLNTGLLTKMMSVFFYYLTSCIQVNVDINVRGTFVVFSLLPLMLATALALKNKGLNQVLFLSIGTALFCGFSATLTAYGRSALGDVRVIGLAPRYASVSLLYWVSVLLCSYYVILEFRKNRTHKSAEFYKSAMYVTISLFGGILLFIEAPRFFAVYKLTNQVKQDADLIVKLKRRGILTDKAMQKLSPDVNYVWPMIEFYDQNNLGGFGLTKVQVKERLLFPTPNNVSTDEIQLCELSGRYEAYAQEKDNGFLVYAHGWAFTGKDSEIKRLTLASLVEKTSQQSYVKLNRLSDVKRMTAANYDKYGFLTVFKTSEYTKQLKILAIDTKAEACSIDIEVSK